MAKPDTATLVVGISSTGLFDLSEARKVFEEGGIKKYREHMLANENLPLEPGTGMPLVRALLGLRRADGQEKPPLVEVVVMSQNSPETGIRIANTVRQMGLPISRFAFTGGEPLADFIEGYYIDLFLSRNEKDVQRVIDSGKCAAALLYDPPEGYEPVDDQVRIAFDADAVLFSDESEVVNKTEGLAAFHERENEATEVPLPDGPFASFLRKLGAVKQATDTSEEYAPVRLAVVTARNAPAEKRVVLTLRHWGVYVDAAYFLGGWEKMPVLRAFRPHVFFDDQDRDELAGLRLRDGRFVVGSTAATVTLDDGSKRRLRGLGPDLFIGDHDLHSEFTRNRTNTAIVLAALFWLATRKQHDSEDSGFYRGTPVSQVLDGGATLIVYEAGYREALFPRFYWKLSGRWGASSGHLDTAFEALLAEVDSPELVACLDTRPSVGIEGRIR